MRPRTVAAAALAVQTAALKTPEGRASFTSYSQAMAREPKAAASVVAVQASAVTILITNFLVGYLLLRL